MAPPMPTSNSASGRGGVVPGGPSGNVEVTVMANVARDRQHEHCLGGVQQREPEIPAPEPREPFWCDARRGRSHGRQTTVGAVGLLRFSYGTMSSGKSTLALQIHHNLAKQSRRGMLLSLFDREGARVSSRLGVSVAGRRGHPGRSTCSPWPATSSASTAGSTTSCATRPSSTPSPRSTSWLGRRRARRRRVRLRAASPTSAACSSTAPGACSRSPTSGSQLQVEARCWCGQRATNNARLVNGALVREGETVVVGDTAGPDVPLFGDVVAYELLCRRHFREGRL